MTAETVIAILAGLLGIVTTWAVFLRKGPKDPVTAMGSSSGKPLANGAVSAIDRRHDEAVDRIEAVEDSDTPATDAADLAAERLKRLREGDVE